MAHSDLTYLVGDCHQSLIASSEGSGNAECTIWRLSTYTPMANVFPVMIMAPDIYACIPGRSTISTFNLCALGGGASTGSDRGFLSYLLWRAIFLSVTVEVLFSLFSLAALLVDQGASSDDRAAGHLTA